MRANKEFSEYVKCTSFNISLSKNHCDFLLLLLNLNENLGRFPMAVVAIKGLVRRGLVVHHEYPEIRAKKIGEYTGIFKGDRPAYTLTKAGYHVAKLIQIAEAV